MTEGRGRGRRWTRGRWLALAGGAGVVVLLGWAMLRGGSGEAVDLGGAGAVRVERGSLQEKVAASGRMEPVVRVPVIAEVSGIIDLVHVEEGDRVEQDQPLFELDHERLAARVAERRAELALAEAQARFDLAGKARAERDQRRRDRDRTAELVERNAASKRDLEHHDHALRLAQIAVNDARAEVASRQAAVAGARERLRQAERDLSNAVIRAPITGVIIERDGEVGRAVANVTADGGTIVAVIADDTRIRLVAEVDENDIAGVRIGQRAILSIDAFPDEEFEGAVRKISSAGSQEANVSSFEVEVELSRDPRLRVGMSADARIVVAEHADVLLVPNDAIRRDPEGPRVVRLDVAGDDSRSITPVRLGYSDGFKTIVLEGLEEGDVIGRLGAGAG